MTPVDRQVLDDHTGALRSLEAAMREQMPLLLAALPQVLGMDDLRHRWHLSQDGVSALLAEHAGYCGARGQRVRVPIEVVLRLDPIAKAAAALAATWSAA